MAAQEFLHQPTHGSLGERLKEYLESNQFNQFYAAVAFAKSSGVLRLKQALETFKSRHGRSFFFIGIDLNGTSYEALSALYELADELYIVHANGAQVFHSKIYYFKGSNNSTFITGSNNLTGGGLWTNIESSLIITGGNESIKELDCLFLGSLGALKNNLFKVNSQADIDFLLQKGLIEKELDSRINQSLFRCRLKNNTSDLVDKIFGGPIKAELPKINSGNSGIRTVQDLPESAAAQSEGINDKELHSGSILWMETRAMTGGSRNILDLSKRAVIKSGSAAGTLFETDNSKQMQGCAVFFGIDPEKTEESKDITLRFENKDYYGNTILFPIGLKANGTWRLQIKGIAADGTKITRYLKSEKEDPSYFANKVAVFTKIDADYYELTIFPIEELEKLEQISKVTAYNGPNSKAKLVGIIEDD